jgi:uncharacterized membrane protein YphA (DoxX/SURF4 family)
MEPNNVIQQGEAAASSAAAQGPVGPSASRLAERLRRLDQRLTTWMARYSISVLRVCLGIVFLWFGVLKLFPDASPAAALATRTIATLTWGMVGPSLSLPLLAGWEICIGLGLITKRFMRTTLVLLLVQMSGTIAPLFLFRAETWTTFPVAGTLEGQYIIKNIVLVAAALVLGATLRGGALVADKDLVDQYRARFDPHRM